MDKNAAKALVKETFQNPFDKDRFYRFTKELLNHFEDAHFLYRGNLIPDAYDPYIQTLERLGKYQDPEGNKIDILIVKLKKESSLEHARTMQRNFIAWYLGGSRGDILKDAALVAFVAPDPQDWRFSLVRMEYKISETPSGKVKAKEEFTPAKRYSFIVGQNETSHTAQSRLVPIIEDDSHDPTLDRLGEAFNIEKVTKEFFDKYRELYLQVKEAIDDLVKRDAAIKKDFEAKAINTVDFSKKLLGQIVFLYFLQKKGWFGVPRGKDWGEGDKQFLRHLFEKAQKENKNYFNKFLEPLFYEALRLERPKDYYDQFDCRIPFLNGGLFDPINDYDWQDTDIILPNELFSNQIKDAKTGDIGTGILDIFDRYNFTVKEDEPLEKEVAVDPEMLGKVFENLLEVKDRKSKGTFYTPREIVHYMCQESLVNYLATELEGKVSKEDIETLIKHGETAVEHDAAYIEKKSKKEKTKVYSKAKLPKSIEKNARFIDEKLEAIRVCDPAVGSGAFPVGMMNEIIRTRNALTPYVGKDAERTPYNFKRHAIQNSLYGVDIDPGAVEIAKLRLWLSLVVDEESRETVQPLPNLDYKIMQGNSLIELLSFTPTNDHERNKIVDQLKVSKDELFGVTSPEAKKKKRGEIDNLIKRLFEYDRNKQIEELQGNISSIQSQKRLFEDERDRQDDKIKIQEIESKIKEIKSLKIPGPAEHFEWHINFSEVFQEKEGFDVVIANPPYVNVFELEKDTNFDKQIYRNKYKSASGAFDLYILFHERCIELAKHGGISTLISPNKFLSAEYAEKLRYYITENTTFTNLLDLSSVKIFEASVYPVVSIYKKELLDVPIVVSRGYGEIGNVQIQKIGEYLQFELKNSPKLIWSFLIFGYPSIYQKINSHRRIIDACDVTASFSVDEAYKIKELIYEINKTKQGLTHKKLLISSNIHRYYATWGRSSITYLKTRYLKPVVALDAKTLSKHRLKQIEGEKIIIAGMTKELRAFWDAEGEFVAGIPTIILTNFKTDSRYILGLINSKLYDYYFHQLFGSLSLAGGYLRIGTPQVSSLPFKQISEVEQKPFVDLVDKILVITKADDYLENPAKQAKVREYEKQIDQLVYKLYGLTPEEIKIIENARRKK